MRLPVERLDGDGVEPDVAAKPNMGHRLLARELVDVSLRRLPPGRKLLSRKKLHRLPSRVVTRLAPTTLPRDQGLLGTALTGGGSGVIVGAPRKGNAMARQLLTMLVPGRTVTKRARGCGHRRHVVPAAVVAAACMVALMPSAAAARQPYLRGPFGPATVHRVVRDLGRVGIGVYRPGSARPVARVRGRRSPVRLTSEQARTLAFGAWARSGATGSAISARTGRVRISRHRRVASAIMLAGWAKRARTPSARLARRLLGTVRWRRYRQVVFPSVVQLLFASDMALHLRPHARRHAHGATAVAAAGGRARRSRASSPIRSTPSSRRSAASRPTARRSTDFSEAACWATSSRASPTSSRSAPTPRWTRRTGSSSAA